MDITKLKVERREDCATCDEDVWIKEVLRGCLNAGFCSFIPIFILMLIPILFLEDHRLAVLWLIIDILVSWQIAS